MLAQEPAVADHRVAVHADQPRGGPDPVAVGQVLDQGQGLLRRQSGAEQRGALALGEAGLAGAAVEQPILLGLAVMAADGQVAVPPLGVVGAIGALAAEAGQVLFHGGASVILGRTQPGSWRRTCYKRRTYPVQSAQDTTQNRDLSLSMFRLGRRRTLISA